MQCAGRGPAMGPVASAAALLGHATASHADAWKTCSYNDRPIPCRDSLGGIWQREILVQGNAVFTSPANGKRILVPLR
jgi:hypothetical protein